LILIDTVSRGEEPGTVFLIEPDAGPGAAAPSAAAGALPPVCDAHGLDPDSVLRMVAALGGRPPRVLLVGCEPAEITERIGLSAIVARAVDEAVRIVRSLVNAAPAPGPEPPGADSEPGLSHWRLPCSSASS